MSVREPEKDAAAAAAEVDEKAEAEAEAKGSGSVWELLYCGRTSFNTKGREHGTQGNLVSPTRLRPLVGVDIRFVASGCSWGMEQSCMEFRSILTWLQGMEAFTAACHCAALDGNGRCYTWGHNEKGQLGHGDTLLRALPTVVSELSKLKIIKASVGRNHTVVVTDDNKSFSFGHNGHGQLGLGLIEKEIESSPLPCAVVGATDSVCGADFTVWLSSVKDSSILTAGLNQYGQLGQDADIQLTHYPKPRAIDASFKNTVVKVACGTNHTVAIDNKGFVYTWGFGGSGRLGHGAQNDEWKPRQLLFFEKHMVLRPNAIVSAGSASSACTSGGELYTWGKSMDTDDYSIHPKSVPDLSGWNIRCMASGDMHHIVGTDDTCISWGIGLNGQLGYGPNGPKSSSNPKKVDSLQGMPIRCWRLIMVIPSLKEQETEMASEEDHRGKAGGDLSIPELKPSRRGRGRPKKTESPASGAGSSGGGKRGKRGRP
ncbi:protein RCC2 isoform X5 [Setaria italica]|uniref:protein RCC2 isoform X5 n=1 Tax=Setaria italica TaxID=4555 RepID=UPI00064636BE|nr:protein RCC2 isoform X5 [Setaria italica]